MASPRRYLLPSERLAIVERLHWAALAAVTLQSLGLLVIGLFLIRVFGGTGLLETLAVYFTAFVVLRWVGKVADWWVEKFIVTDKRVLLVTGIAYKRVAIMPLIKVTDLTFKRSATGLLFGYGEFVFESAGQDQALSNIEFIPKPDKLYAEMSELLFGGEKGVPALPSPAEREAELRLGERALDRRRRLFRTWRRRPGRPGGRSAREDQFADLDDLLDRRDTLLAERERRWREGPRRTEETYRDADDSADSADEMPRIHHPRRDTGREPRLDEPTLREPTLREPTLREPPPRWPPDDEPRHAPPIDPADD